MSFVESRVARTGTLIDAAGAAMPVMFDALVTREVGTFPDGAPAVVLEVDFAAHTELALSGRYMLELEDGETIELEIVFGLALAEGRFYYKGLGVR